MNKNTDITEIFIFLFLTIIWFKESEQKFYVSKTNTVWIWQQNIGLTMVKLSK